MSIVLEFTIASEEFRLGEVLSGPSEMQFELERVVPTGNMIMPFVWAIGVDHASFVDQISENPLVEELLVLDELEDRTLYRIEWNDSPTDLVEDVAAADGTILQARGNREWTFQIRFPDHERLSQFHDDVLADGISLHVNRTYSLSESSGDSRSFGLTAEQHRALVLALEAGYFATPRETNLDQLADKLDITPQAFSERVRRANEKVLQDVLLESAE